jgi:TolB protein
MARRTSYLVMIAAAVACSVALSAVLEQAEAAFPGKNGTIAFQGFRDAGTAGNSNSEIITVSPDGTGMKQLTSSSDGSSDPTYSPDGKMIAWARGGDIWVMSRSGNAKTKKALTDNSLSETSPAWSPDGTEIAFKREQSDPASDGLRADVWVMNADGSGQKKLTGDFDHESSPTWSPDGTKIAFVDGGDIWTVKPDGSQRRNITNTPDLGEFDPDFSPDGKKLAFTSKGQYKKTDIYTMNLDGSDLTNVTDSRYVDEEDGVWSPSGNDIAYSKALVENVEIFKKRADGTGRAKNVSNDPKYNESPDWGPRPTTATG